MILAIKYKNNNYNNNIIIIIITSIINFRLFHSPLCNQEGDVCEGDWLCRTFQQGLGVLVWELQQASCGGRDNTATLLQGTKELTPWSEWGTTHTHTHTHVQK